MHGSGTTENSQNGRLEVKAYEAGMVVYSGLYALPQV